MPSFDTVLEPNLVEVKNAVEQTQREVGTRFDFKGSSAAIELKDKEITLFGDADFQLQQVEDIVAIHLETVRLSLALADGTLLDAHGVEARLPAAP
jgi:uncharacterized protein YajQ (UPF0234 family)